MNNSGSILLEARENRAIYRAIKIIEARLKDDNANVLKSPNAVKDYLRLLLGSEEREVFTVILLDVSHRVIDARGLFYGTLLHTEVSPREVIRYAL